MWLLIIFECIKLVSTLINKANFIDALGDSAAIIVICFIIETLLLKYGTKKALKPIAIIFIIFSFINFAHVLYKFDGTDINNNFLLGMDNRFIFYFLPMVCFSIIIDQNSNNKYKFLTFISFCISLLSLFYTRSIGALIGLVLLLVYYIVFIKFNKNIKIINHKYVLLIILLLNVLILFLNIQYLFKEIIFLLGKEPTFNGRIYLWEKGIKLFVNKPLLGYGVNKAFLIKYLFGYNHFHNIILNYLFEGGILLFSVFILMNITVSNKLIIYKNYKTTKILSACILISLFLGLVDTLDYAFFYVLYILAYHCDKLIIPNEKRNVGIITFFDSTSYGGVLQSFATLKAIEKIGYTAEFINYKNQYEQKIIKKEEGFLLFIKKIVRRLIINVIYSDWYYRNKSFGSNLLLYNGKISMKKYYNINEMNDVDNKYLIVGSDQVWNPAITNGIDEAFLLNFGKNNIKISFSSSMGSHRLNEDEKQVFKKNLEKFSHISVRENYVKNSLSFLKNKDIKVTCDPTLLFNCTQWCQLLSEFPNRYKKITDDYILTFFVGGSSDEYIEYINHLKNKTKLRVYNIHKNKHKRNSIDKSLAGVNVAEFVYLIKNAKYIITDSFHGVVFSLLFNKKIIPVSNKSNPIRVYELLKDVDLDGLIDNKDAYLYKINYKKVENKLKIIREYSYNYLKESLGCDKNEKN